METGEKVKKIIIIDDSRHCDYIEKDVKEYVLPLAPLTYKAYTFEEAKEKYESNPDVEIMIVDISIDRLDLRTDTGNSYLGLDLIEEIRKKNSTVHLIAYTAYDDNEEIKLKQRLHAANAYYINKYSMTDSTKELLEKVYKFLIE